MGGLDDCASPPLKRLKLMPSSSELHLEGASSSSPTQESPAAISMAKAHVAVDDGNDDSSDTNVGPTGLIRRSELVRVITQSLQALGYQKTASLLEKEAGIPLQSQLVTNFRNQILCGDWDDAIASMRLLLQDPQSYNVAAALILQQKFFEHLERQDTMEALKTLRLEISPLQVKKERLHELATCLICPSRVESPFLKTKKVGETAREQLLQELQGFLPPSVMIPERRLEHLIEQALIVQRKSCIFHNSVDQPLSLYSDHQCGRDQIPNQTLQVLEVHDNEVWFLQFSHDGKYLASASKDCTAIIWEVLQEGLVKLKYTLTGHAKPVSFIAWSPDDSLILTCGNEEVIKLWDVASGECKHIYDKGSSFTACAWFPDGKRFISSGCDKCIYNWDIEGKELDSWKGIRVPRINDLTITADGNHMISICEKDIRIFNLETKGERVINEDQSITSLSVSKDGRYLLVNLVSQEIHLWDMMDSAKLLFKYSGHRQTRYVIRSCFGGFNQAFVVSGSEDSQVYIWHRGNGEILEVLPGHSGTVNCVSWNPVNPYMFASASDDHTIRIWGVMKSVQHKQKAESTSNGIMHLDNGGPIKCGCLGLL
ncbi:hypothetical protein GOP47_0009924 [Adiantum capillus-veneris]|uniref:Uncharacterized protein n=1 Tax=Adiantum capillus-veneris TaxID=13818 RepID=A0A9D4UWZ9_ADICA|nr:hypothetical protein GOP47_0009426 [Adiantum capillus-veneris]KAI5075848.1 hypothetical protein GOP47_0009924 [Adiantum capillus-veneris]